MTSPALVKTEAEIAEPAAPFKAIFTATDPKSLQTELDRAEADALEAASIERTRGILITRHDHTTFTIELTTNVPYGTTREHDTSRP